MSRAKSVGVEIVEDGLVLSVELQRFGRAIPELIALQVPEPGVIVVPAECALSEVDYDVVLKEARRLYDRRRLEIEAAVQAMTLRRSRFRS